MNDNYTYFLQEDGELMIYENNKILLKISGIDEKSAENVFREAVFDFKGVFVPKEIK